MLPGVFPLQLEVFQLHNSHSGGLSALTAAGRPAFAGCGLIVAAVRDKSDGAVRVALELTEVALMLLAVLHQGPDVDLGPFAL